MPILLHTTQRIRNKLSCSYLAECKVTSNTTLTLHSTTLFSWLVRGINTNPFTLQQENIKEIELSLIWIRSESHVNLNRAPRKLYLNLKPIWNEVYFKSKWNFLQKQMKPVSIAKKAFLLYCISKIVRDKAKIVTDAWGINLLFAICHAYESSGNQPLARFFLKNVMDDRWFAKKTASDESERSSSVFKPPEEMPRSKDRLT